MNPFLALNRTAALAGLLLLAGALAGTAQAQTGALNDTGQTSCYDASNAAVVCSDITASNTSERPHQDARYGRDAAFAAGQFTKTGGGAAGFDFTRICWNGADEGTTTGPNQCTGTLVANTTDTPSGTPATDWACTRDNVTGAVWSLQSQQATWNTATEANYPDAGHNTNSRCGFTDWRLPNRRELFGIVHMGASSPRIDTSYFPSAESARYWTSDASAPDPANAWVVNFSFGVTSASSKANTNRVRLVRAGQSVFTFTPDPTTGTTVTQSGTGLVWDRCVRGLSGSTCTGTAQTYSWAQALAEVTARNAANHLGFSDWRLPNVKELESLIKIDSTTAPAIDAAAFPNTPTGSFGAHWTSSSYEPNPAVAWVVYFSDGNANANFKTDTVRVRLVRAGQSFSSFDAFPPVAGACGSAHASSTPVAAAPSTNLCAGGGTASGVSTSAADFSWTCTGLRGGSTASCSATRGYTVSPTAGANGSISPNTPQLVAYNTGGNFTVAPSSGYSASVGGSCGGALGGTAYTTAAVTANCTVVASFSDSVPDAFTFAAAPNVALSTLVTSAPITVAGIVGQAAISIIGGAYRINSAGGFVTTPGMVVNGNTIEVQHTSSGSASTATTTWLTIGGVSASYVSTTAGLAAVNGSCGSANATSPLATSAPTTTTALCTAGAATAVTTGTAAYTWVCNGINGGTNSATCSASRGYTVTPSAGANGSVTPNTAQVVALNARPAFAVAANSGFSAGVVSGCGGALSSGTFTTNAVTADCSVTAFFAANAPPESPAPPPPPTVGTGTVGPLAGTGQTVVVTSSAAGSASATLLMTGSINLQLPGGAGGLLLSNPNPASPAQVNFVAGPGGAPVPVLTSGTLTFTGSTPGQAVLGGLVGADGLALVVVADQVPLVLQVITTPSGTTVFAQNGSLRLASLGVPPAPRAAGASSADTLLYGGESARFDARGRVSAFVLGSPDGGQNALGDALGLGASTPALQRADFVPRLQGSSARLGRNLADALVAQLKSTGGFAEASLFNENALLITTRPNGQRQVWQAKGRVAIDAGAIISIADSAANTGASGQNDAQNPVIAGAWQQNLNGIRVLWAPSLLGFDAMVQALADANARLVVQTDGSYLLQLGDQRYSAQAASTLTRPSAASPGFGVTEQGGLNFGAQLIGQQTLHPTAADLAGLLRLLKAADANATAQADAAQPNTAASSAAFEATGQLRVVFQGATYSLVPDMALVPIPSNRSAQAFWLEGAKLFVALPALPGLAQGFAVR